MKLRTLSKSVRLLLVVPLLAIGAVAAVFGAGLGAHAGGALASRGTSHAAGAPRANGPTCRTDYHIQPASNTGPHEALLANLSVTPGSTVKPGETITMLYTDDKPMGTSTSTLASPYVSINNHLVQVTVTSTSGVTPRYQRPSDGGSMTTACQDVLTFKIPSTSATKYSVQVHVYDGDGDHEMFCWDFVGSGSTGPGVVSKQSILPNDTGFVANGAHAYGKMRFNLYGPKQPHCTGTPIWTEVVRVVKGMATTTNTSFVPGGPGKYRWKLFYYGDKHHPKANSVCGSEWFMVEDSGT